MACPLTFLCSLTVIFEKTSLCCDCTLCPLALVECPDELAEPIGESGAVQLETPMDTAQIANTIVADRLQRCLSCLAIIINLDKTCATKISLFWKKELLPSGSGKTNFLA